MGKKKGKFKNFRLDSNQVKNEQIAQAQAQIAENDKSQKTKQQKVKKIKKVNPNKKKFGAGTKETIAELKKVAWPSFGKVVKTTGVVLAVVSIFTVILLGIDLGLNQLHKLLIK